MKATILGVFLALMPACIQATPLGQLKLGGEAEVTLTTIDWAQLFVPGPAYNGTGTAGVTGASGIFAVVPFLSPLTIIDRDGTVQPAGIPLLFPGWLSGPGLGALVFDLTYILPGLYTSTECFAAAADQQTCTPSAPTPFTSPYNLSNFNDGSGLSSNATFTVRGYLRDTVSGENVGVFDGVFGAEFQNQSYQEVLATVLGGGSVISSYSATLTVNEIPEPSTVALSVLGIALLGTRLIRRRSTQCHDRVQ